jgi:hypothetical protein
MKGNTMSDDGGSFDFSPSSSGDSGSFDFSSGSSGDSGGPFLGVIVSPGVAITILAAAAAIWVGYRTVKAESFDNKVAASTAVCLAGNDPAINPPSFGTLWSFPNAEIPSSERIVSISDGKVFVTEQKDKKVYIGPDNTTGTRYLTSTYLLSLNGERKADTVGYGHIEIHGGTRRVGTDRQIDVEKFSPEEASRAAMIKQCVGKAVELRS